MTDAPVDEFDDVHPDVLAALVANDKNAQALPNTWLNAQSIRHWLAELDFSKEAERKLIIDAWAGVAHAARAARSEHSEAKLAKIDFGPHSPPAVSGQPPTISAADFAMVIRSEDQLGEARDRQGAALSEEAVRACDLFIGRMEAHLHA